MSLIKIFSKKKADNAAGLAMYSSIFRYIDIEESSSGSYIVNSALADRTDGGSSFRDVFEKLNDFTKKNKPPLSVALPVSETMVNVLYLPMELEDARRALRYELEKFFPVNSAEAMFDIAEVDYPFAEQYDGRHYLVAVTRKAQVERLVSTGRHYGYKIECIEPAQIALERAVAPYSRRNAALFVYAGSNYIQYILFWHNNGIFYRSSDFNSFKFSETSDAAKLKAEAVDNFIREIQLFLEDSYVKTRISPSTVIMFGPSADREFCHKISENFPSMSFDYIDLLELNCVEMEDSEKASGYWDIALGLAMRHFDGNKN